jgi:hypothetical protein
LADLMPVKNRSLTPAQYGALADVPPEIEWLANIPKGITERKAPNGSTVQRRANGTPSEIHDTKRGMTVHHGLNGGRRVMVEDHNHNRTVYQKGRAGYVQHPYSYHGHTLPSAPMFSTAALIAAITWVFPIAEPI